jgi:hypothetical protein
MFNRSAAVALLIALPALAVAQRGGGGGRTRGDKSADYSSMVGNAFKLSNRDLENISPIKLLIDKRKDLKLTDDQIAKLKDREDKLKESTKPAFSALDSLRRAAAPMGSKADEGDAARVGSTRRAFTEVVKGLRTQYDAAFSDALPILDETQQKQATDLAQKQRSEADDMINDKLGRP